MSQLVDNKKSVATRGNLKLVKQRAQSRVRSNFFSVRATERWNKLPSTIREAATLNQFKNQLDADWEEDRFRTPYGAFADYQLIGD